MKRIKVMLVDEDQNVAEDWKTSLDSMRLRTAAGKVDVDILDIDHLKKCIEQLTKRRERAREDKCDPPVDANLIDAIDVFIIDYDLLGSNGDIGHTGEELAYLVRCYSSCKVIVAVNQFTRENVFELDLTGHPESFADVNITAPQLANPGLWHSPWATHFRPWYWPVLPDLAYTFDARSEFVRRDPKEPILTALGFDDDMIQALPRNVEAFLSKKKPAASVSFEDFVWSSGNGLKPKDKAGEGRVGEERISRIAAARVHRWLALLLWNVVSRQVSPIRRPPSCT